MRLCISLGRLSVSWRAAGVPYLICPHLAQPLSGPAWRKNRGSSLRRRAVLYPLLHVSFAALAPEGGVRTRSGKPLRAGPRLPARPAHRRRTPPAGAGHRTGGHRAALGPTGGPGCPRRRHRYGPPGPWRSPRRLKVKVAELRERLVQRDETVAELTTFKELAVSRLAPQHDEIGCLPTFAACPSPALEWPVRIVQLSLTSPDHSSTAREPVGVACGVPSP